jgi:hypothetical protein
MIVSSRSIANNHMFLEQYRKTLKPGDLTLLGLLTEGGQGLATADNGRFVGVRNKTKEASDKAKPDLKNFMIAALNKNIVGLISIPFRDAKKLLAEYELN